MVVWREGREGWCGNSEQRGGGNTRVSLSRVSVLTMLTLWVRNKYLKSEMDFRVTSYFQVMLVLGCVEIVYSLPPGGRVNPHHHHGGVAGHHQSLQSEGGQVRRGRDLDNNLLDFSSAELDPDTGLKCLRMENESVAGVERERLLSCTHSSINICHFTYVTRFRPARERVCDEIYTKNCNIVFNKVTR